MRALWSLPKAVPALLRHIIAYAELAALDFARAKREIGSIFIATAVAGLCAIFFVLLACLTVIAYFWDTSHRIAAIGWLAGGFLAVAIIALAYARRMSSARTPFLEDMRSEWGKDKVILERVLTDEE